MSSGGNAPRPVLKQSKLSNNTSEVITSRQSHISTQTGKFQKMAANETRFTPFGISDILKAQGHELGSNTQLNLTEESNIKTKIENDLKDKSNQEMEPKRIPKDKLKTLSENSSESKGKA